MIHVLPIITQDWTVSTKAVKSKKETCRIRPIIEQTIQSRVDWMVYSVLFSLKPNIILQKAIATLLCDHFSSVLSII